MVRTTLTFSFCGKAYSFAVEPDGVLKGRLSCDCGRSALIQEYCDTAFPILKCGNKIVLISLAELAGEKFEPAAQAGGYKR